MIPPIALTMGEPAGIGGEISLRAWTSRQAEEIPPFFLIDEIKRLEKIKEEMELTVPLVPIAHPEEALQHFKNALPVLPLNLPVPVCRGKPDTQNNIVVLQSIEKAVSYVQNSEASALVTNPIHKKTLYETGFSYGGHTEYLAALAGDSYQAVMMLSACDLNVVPLTVHVPVKDISMHLTQQKILDQARVVVRALKEDFCISTPRLAVAALNPHAGEQGAIGREEIDVIAPAIQQLSTEGINVQGPMPADTLFHDQARRQYDAVLCMYHDQALIPLKTLDFYGGVNITLGLPFVRTSPDHGTGFDLQTPARCDSLVQALKKAHFLSKNRQHVPDCQYA